MQQRIARTLCLSVAAALGLMAFTAVAAQAEELSDGGKTGSFLVKKEKALVKLGVTFGFTQIGTGTILVPGRVDILCTTGTAGGEFHNESDVLATATFTNCTTWQPVIILGNSHTISIPCTVQEPIVLSGLGSPKIHNGEPYILLEGSAGANQLFGHVTLSGAECPLTKLNEVRGSIVAKIDSNDTTEPLLLFNHTIQKLFQVGAAGDHLKFGALEAYLDAEARINLTDPAHKGLTFGVC
jgi:hypothetical protein